MVDHLSQLEPNNEIQEDLVQINEKFPDEQLLSVEVDPWFANIANYLIKQTMPA